MLMKFDRQEQDGCMMIITKQDEMRWVNKAMLNKKKPIHYHEQSDYSAFCDDESD